DGCEREFRACWCGELDLLCDERVAAVLHRRSRGRDLGAVTRQPDVDRNDPGAGGDNNLAPHGRVSARARANRVHALAEILDRVAARGCWRGIENRELRIEKVDGCNAERTAV